MRVAITNDLVISTETKAPSWESFEPIKHSRPTDGNAPLTWWRTRTPNQFRKKDALSLRIALVGTQLENESRWRDAIIGDDQAYAATAIGVCVRQIKKHPIDATAVDLAVSATLAYAILGDAASAVLMSWALKHRAKIDPPCAMLSDLWLVADLGDDCN